MNLTIDRKNVNLTIDRKKWYRGRMTGSALLVEGSGGKMCCLGFLSLACGLDKKHIRAVPAVCDLRLTDGLPESLQFLVHKRTKDNTKIGQDLMDTNDNVNLTEEEREKKLTKLFAKKGIKVKFIN